MHRLASRLFRHTSSILAPAKIVKCKQIVSKLRKISLKIRAHNLKVVGSIPAPATNRGCAEVRKRASVFLCRAATAADGKGSFVIAG